MAITTVQEAIQTIPSNYSPEYLKNSLAAELDKIGNGNQRPDEDRVRTMLRDWPRDLSSTLPDSLLYPVEESSPGVSYNPQSDIEVYDDRISTGLLFLHYVEGMRDGDPSEHIDKLNQRGRAVMFFLLRLSRGGLRFKGGGMLECSKGIDYLLDKVPGAHVADALHQLNSHASEGGLVVDRINRYIERVVMGDVKLLDVEEAQGVFDICTRFHKGLNMPEQLDLIIKARAGNIRFCLALVLQIMEKMKTGDISEETARSWYQTFRERCLDGPDILEITGAAADLPGHRNNFSKINGCCDPTVKLEGIAPMSAKSVCYAFSEMVNRGWHEEAVDFLEQLILEQLPEVLELKYPEYLFHTFWLPFFGHLINLYRDGGSPQWQEFDAILKDVLMAVLLIYTTCVVGREPEKNELRRAKLNEESHCRSCKAIDGFLVDTQRTRQIFQVKSSKGREIPNPYMFCVSRSALSHITRTLGHPGRDCAFHVRNSKAAGPVSVIQKRTNKREWTKWKGRMSVGKKALALVVKTDFFRNMMGGKANCEKWEELRFLERGFEGEVRSPFMTKHPRHDPNTLLYTLRNQSMEELLDSFQDHGYDPEAPAVRWMHEYYEALKLT